MFFQCFNVLTLLAIHVSAAAYHRQSVVKTNVACPSSPDSVHIVGVRGTLEEPGFGALQEVVDKLIDVLPGSDAVAIIYPADGITVPEDGGDPEYNFGDYVASESQGYAALMAEIEHYVDSCPNTDIVLMGYSQGAHVVGDALCGGGSILFPSKLPLDTEYTSSIRAIIQLGDPTNRADTPWHVGNSTGRGIFPRQKIDACRSYGDHWQSYCDADDFFCDSGDSIPVHFSYVANYLDEIVEFIVDQVQDSRYRVSKPCMDKDLRI